MSLSSYTNINCIVKIFMTLQFCHNVHIHRTASQLATNRSAHAWRSFRRSCEPKPRLENWMKSKEPIRIRRKNHCSHGQIIPIHILARSAVPRGQSQRDTAIGNARAVALIFNGGTRRQEKIVGLECVQNSLLILC